MVPTSCTTSAKNRTDTRWKVGIVLIPFPPLPKILVSPDRGALPNSFRGAQMGSENEQFPDYGHQVY